MYKYNIFCEMFKYVKCSQLASKTLDVYIYMDNFVKHWKQYNTKSKYLL